MNTESIVNKIKTAPTWMKLTTVGLLSFGLYEGFNHKEDILSPPKVASAQELTSKKVGDEVVMEFVVENSYRTQDGKVLLNSMKKFNDPANITVVCNGSQVSDVEGIVGKTVKITGKKTQYSRKGKDKQPATVVDQITATKVEIK